MASLLVFLDAERAKTLIAPDQRNSGRSWMIERTQLPELQLDRLDDEATLFVCTIETDRVIIVATVDDPEFADGAFTGGDALLRDYDITDLAPRLGSTGDLARWSSVPRILPPSDVDLLRYTIGLANDLARAPAPPEPIVDNDATADELRAAVFADPRADEPRAIYADYLQSRGDPRGELIALQLARYRSEAAVSDRERTLVQRYAKDCLHPLRPVLHDFELARGFLHRAQASYDLAMPDALVGHPAWSTVDVLSATDVRLLCSTHVRARRLGIRGGELVHLVRAKQPLPYETIIGLETRGKRDPSYRSHGGIATTNWVEIMTVGALANLRTLSVNYAAFAPYVPDFFRSPLCDQLDHLDVWTATEGAPVQLREAFDRSQLSRLTIRFSLPPASGALEWRPGVVGFRRSTREPILTLQLDHTLVPSQLVELMRFLAPLTRGIARIELNDLAAPKNPEARHTQLIDRLGTIFARVAARPGASLAP